MGLKLFVFRVFVRHLISWVVAFVFFAERQNPALYTSNLALFKAETVNCSISSDLSMAQPNVGPTLPGD